MSNMHNARCQRGGEKDAREEVRSRTHLVGRAKKTEETAKANHERGRKLEHDGDKENRTKKAKKGRAREKER